jgi:serine/threonine-protein kinase RsbW
MSIEETTSVAGKGCVSLMTDGTTSRQSITLDSELVSIDTIEQTALDFAQRAGFDEDTASNIAMVAREAAANAVIHGNQYAAGKHVTATFEASSDSVLIRVADQGTGFDASNIPDPLAPENLLRSSGRGVFLMRAFMDEVNFRQLSPGTEITLIKRRKS